MIVKNGVSSIPTTEYVYALTAQINKDLDAFILVAILSAHVKIDNGSGVTNMNKWIINELA